MCSDRQGENKWQPELLSALMVIEGGQEGQGKVSSLLHHCCPVPPFSFCKEFGVKAIEEEHLLSKGLYLLSFFHPSCSFPAIFHVQQQ